MFIVEKMSKSSIGKVYFSRTLDILKKNKTSLKVLNAKKKQQLQKNFDNHSVLTSQILKDQVRVKNQQKLAYRTLYYEYIQNYPHLLLSKNNSNDKLIYKSIPNLTQLDKLFQCNPALANFSGDVNEIKQLVLLKVIHIALNLIEKQNNSDLQLNKQHEKLWQAISDRIQQLYRNPSIMDNNLIMLIIYTKKQYFSQQFANQVLKLLRQQVRFMSEHQKQYTFFMLTKLKVISQIQSKTDEESDQSRLQKQIRKLKTEIIQSLTRMRLPLQSMRTWISLHSLYNASNTTILSDYFDRYLKIMSYQQKTKPTINNQTQKQKNNSNKQIQTILACLQHQNILSSNYVSTIIGNTAQKIIQYYSKNQSIQYQNNKRLKMYLSLFNIQSKRYLLNSDELLPHQSEPYFTQGQKLRYLYKLWKYDILQNYELENIYESIEMNFNESIIKFAHIHQVYYAIIMQLALNKQKNERKILQWLKNIDYIPRGMQFFVFSYFKRIQNRYVNLFSKEQTALNNQAQQLINQVQEIGSTLNQKNKKYNKAQKLLQQLNQQKKFNKQIQEISKFFKSIQIYQFNQLAFVTPAHYLVHFYSEQLSIVLHCLKPQDYINSENPGSSNFHNQFLLKQRLFKQHHSIDTLNMQVDKFIEMNYNERVDWLRTCVGQILHKRKDKYPQIQSERNTKMLNITKYE